MEAARLLRESPTARRDLQDRYRFVLVDEFQDTDPLQYEIVLFLAEVPGEAASEPFEARLDAGRLFVVGDAKQSIYRFRGADVSVFRRAQREIRAGGRSFTLSTSYRGHRALIEGLNALLEPVLGGEEDPARPYVEPFSPIQAHRPEPNYGLQPPYVELHLALGAKSAGALDAAARALVTGPELLLADEPTGNLDQQTGEGIMEILCSLNRHDNLTIVMVTHDMTVAERADRVVRLVNGRIEEA